jgi:hypothetical protein
MRNLEAWLILTCLLTTIPIAIGLMTFAVISRGLIQSSLMGID